MLHFPFFQGCIVVLCLIAIITLYYLVFTGRIAPLSLFINTHQRAAPYQIHSLRLENSGIAKLGTYSAVKPAFISSHFQELFNPSYLHNARFSQPTSTQIRSYPKSIDECNPHTKIANINSRQTRMLLVSALLPPLPPEPENGKNEKI